MLLLRNLIFENDDGLHLCEDTSPTCDPFLSALGELQVPTEPVSNGFVRLLP